MGFWAIVLVLLIEGLFALLVSGLTVKNLILLFLGGAAGWALDRYLLSRRQKAARAAD